MSRGAIIQRIPLSPFARPDGFKDCIDDQHVFWSLLSFYDGVFVFKNASAKSSIWSFCWKITGKSKRPLDETPATPLYAVEDRFPIRPVTK
jgi:hypothetical protein